MDDLTDKLSAKESVGFDEERDFKFDFFRSVNELNVVGEVDYEESVEDSEDDFKGDIGVFTFSSFLTFSTFLASFSTFLSFKILSFAVFDFWIGVGIYVKSSMFSLVV